MKLFLLSVCVFLILFISIPSFGFAQIGEDITDTLTADEATDSASLSADDKEKLEAVKDITKPEEENTEFITLFSQRPIDQPGFLNAIGYSVQYAVKAGVPANTIILILLLPLLASIIVFVRQIIGLPTLEMWVPIALSITLLSTGITAGAILLVTILFASIVARFLLKRIRVMQLPKMALSIFVVSIFVFISLTVSASMGVLTVRQLSIFPILLLILLSEKIVTLQLTRSARETFLITSVTLLLGIFGFMILSFEAMRRYLLLYPELLLLLIPFNIIMGRYFGLRLTEYIRFSALRKYANQQ